MRLLLAALLAVGFTSGLRAQEAKKDGDAKKSKTVQIAVIKINDLSESPAPPGLFGAQVDTLRSVQDRIKKAAKDSEVKALWLDVQGGLGRGQAHEIRQSVNDFKKSGKKVFATIEAGDTSSYLIACCADEIMMPPLGMLLLTGVRMEMSFYKDLFDKLDVKFDTLQMGDFKNAGEPFSRSSMSEPLKKHMNAILDDIYAQMIDVIATGRKKSADEVKKLIDEGPYTVEGAKAAGLIDRVEYPNDFKTRVMGEWKVDDITLKMNYGKKKADTDFDGLPGLMKLLNELAGKDTAKKSTKPRIALLHAVGMIMPGKSAESFLSGAVMGSDTIVEAIKKIEKDPNIKAIVMRVDSPGGSALASDLIWQALKASSKPIVVSMGDVAGSGGYYIAMGANKIYAEPGTITGSIGVIMQKPAIDGFFKKIGINTEELARGKNSGVMSERAWTESEREAMRKLAEDVYKQFTSKAAKGRKMDLAKLESLAGGRIWTGNQAKANGLIDEIGTLEDAIAEARKLGKLDPKDTEIESFPKASNPFEALFGEKDGDGPADAAITARIVKAFGVEVPKPMKTLLQMPLLSKEHILFVPQMAVEIK